MSEPTNLAEYEQRFADNASVEGYGLDVTQRIPCAFCAARDFMVIKVIDAHDALQIEATCSECGRSGKCIVQRMPGGGVSSEFVQTGGEDPPAWLDPAPRRIG